MKQSTILIGGIVLASATYLYYSSTHATKAADLPPGAKVDTASGLVTFDANRTWNPKTKEITGIGPNRVKSVIGHASTLKEAMQQLGIVTPATAGSPVKGAQQTPPKAITPTGQQPSPAAPRLPRQGPQLPAAAPATKAVTLVDQRAVDQGGGYARNMLFYSDGSTAWNGDAYLINPPLVQNPTWSDGSGSGTGPSKGAYFALDLGPSGMPGWARNFWQMSDGSLLPDGDPYRIDGGSGAAPAQQPVTEVSTVDNNDGTATTTYSDGSAVRWDITTGQAA